MTQGKSPLAWLGGKSQLADRIIDRMPTHTTYCEVFAGAAWVLFKKPESKVEIINDINRELTNLYRVVKHHLAELVLQFRWMLVARDQFDDFMATPPEALTDIQRAARFFYLAKTAFGAKIAKPTFGIAATQGPRLNLLRVEEASERGPCPPGQGVHREQAVRPGHRPLRQARHAVLPGPAVLGM